jgi:hypothetical protein
MPELSFIVPPAVIAPQVEGAQEEEAVQKDADIRNALKIMNELIPVKLEEGKVYEIRYDSARLGEYQRQSGMSNEFSPEALLKTYVQSLQMRVPCKDPDRAKEIIKLIECPTRNDKEQDLISVTCYEDRSKARLVGEGRVNIKGNLQDQELRIIGMLNMALAASNIPNNISAAEAGEYSRLIDLIRNQYREITGKELPPDNLTQNVRFIELPRSTPLPVDEMKEYYRLTITRLQQAA